MNIHEIRQKIKSERGIDVIVVILIIISMGIIAFCLGRLSVLPEDRDSPKVKIIVPEASQIKSSSIK